MRICSFVLYWSMFGSFQQGRGWESGLTTRQTIGCRVNDTLPARSCKSRYRGIPKNRGERATGQLARQSVAVASSRRFQLHCPSVREVEDPEFWAWPQAPAQDRNGGWKPPLRASRLAQYSFSTRSAAIDTLLLCLTRTTRSATSCCNLTIASATGIAPRSPSIRSRTETVWFSASRGPTISM